MRNAKWLQIMRRLTPFWLGLWLMASLGGPAAAYQHLSCAFCETCTRTESTLDEHRSLESPVEVSASAPDNCRQYNCRQCCASTSRQAPEKRLPHHLQTAIFSARIILDTPTRREICLRFASATPETHALARPPSRGRAPPVSFSISPFCLSEI